MVLDNKTLLIVGLVVGGLFSLYWSQSELAFTIFGGLIGYLSKDQITVNHSVVGDEVGSDSEVS